MKKLSFLFILVFIFSGCAKVAHLPQLLTLKAASENRDLQKKQVTQERAAFEKVLEAYKNNTLTDYPDKKSVRKNLGEPLLVRDVSLEGRSFERWLYRDPLKTFESEKVYLYFDENEKLTHSEYAQPLKKAASAPVAETAPPI